MAYLLIFTFLLSPAYALRFSLFGLPTNVLMVWVFLVWVMFAGWLVSKKQLAAFWKSCFGLDRKLFVLISLFFFAGIFSLFTAGASREKLGQFLVLFIQPISIFFIARYIFQIKPESKQFLIRAFYFIVALAGIYAVAQYFTRLGLPMAWWGNGEEPKRALSFFEYPNAYALFVTPVLAFLLPDVFQKITAKKALPIVAWGIGGLGLLLSLSRGGWVALAVAAVVCLLVIGNKKYIQTSLLALVVLTVVIFAVPNLRYRVLLPFQGEKSTVSRFSLVHTGLAMVKDSPVFGKGLLGFSTNWYKYNQDPNLAHLDFPHNIFLNFWIDTGLLGLLSFLGLCIHGLWQGLANKTDPIKLGLALFLIALLVHGLIDVPYLKNDLALVFWLVLALGLA